MKDLTHYFGQSSPGENSPLEIAPGYESHGNSKENSHTPVANCASKNVREVKESDVLKQKTLDAEANAESSSSPIFIEVPKTKKKKKSDKIKKSSRRENNCNALENEQTGLVIKKDTKLRRRGKTNSIKSNSVEEIVGDRNSDEKNTTVNSSERTASPKQKDEPLSSPTGTENTTYITHFFKSTKQSAETEKAAKHKNENIKDNLNGGNQDSESKFEAQETVKTGECIRPKRNKAAKLQNPADENKNKSNKTSSQVETDLNSDVVRGKCELKVPDAKGKHKAKHLTLSKKDKKVKKAKKVNLISVVDDDDYDTISQVESEIEESPAGKKKSTSERAKKSDAECVPSLMLNDKKSAKNFSCGSEKMLVFETDKEEGFAVLSPPAEDSRRNSLMNYFQKITKQEALSKAEKVELEVRALVHSPPHTPSKKEKKRTVRSLPGCMTTNIKRKNIKESADKIVVVGAEEMSAEEKKTIENNVTPKKGRSTRCKKSPPKALQIAKLSSRRSLNRELFADQKTSASNASKNLKIAPCKDVSDANSVSSTIESEINQKEKYQTPISNEKTWKLRVCLTPRTYSSAQETLQEDDSECEEIFPVKKRSKTYPETNTERQADFKNSNENPSKSSKQNELPEIVCGKKKPEVKLAPMFKQRKKSQAQIQARQEFLLSGVPDQIKRIVQVHRSFEHVETKLFPTISHVEQRGEDEIWWNLPVVNLNWKSDPELESPLAGRRWSTFGTLLMWKDVNKEMDHINGVASEGPRHHLKCGFSTSVLKPILRIIKQDSPNVKVVNIFQSLRKKFQQHKQNVELEARLTNARRPKPVVEPSPCVQINQMWTEKYKPVTADEIIGNEGTVLQLKNWLESWKKFCEDVKCIKDCTPKAKRKKKSDEDDFIVSDSSSDVDTNSLPTNPALLYGPNGCGKTCSVYALASDLGYKVLEVNASEKRNGKVLLSKLSEATQSHQIHRNTAEQGFTALFGTSKIASCANKKRKAEVSQKPKKDAEDEKNRKLCLILIKDIDIVFEEDDDGLLPAIVNLISTSKRPVILTTTDQESQYVSRFFNSSSLLFSFTLFPEALCTWLRLISLVEGVNSSKAAIESLVSLCRGDARRSLLQIQMWASSGGNNLPIPSCALYGSKKRKKGKGGATDEEDLCNLSAGESDDSSETEIIPVNTDCIAAMLGRDDIVSEKKKEKDIGMIPFPLDLGLLWWNSPRLLGLPEIVHAPLPTTESLSQTSSKITLLDESFIAAFCSDDNGVNEATERELNETSGDSLENEVPSSVCEKKELLPNSSLASSFKSYCSDKEMKKITQFASILSFLDVLSSVARLEEHMCSMEPTSRMRKQTKDGLLLIESVTDGPSQSVASNTRDLSYWIGVNVLVDTMHHMPQSLPKCDFNPSYPSSSEKEWRLALAESKQAMLPIFPLFVYLDHHALAVDYTSAVQTFVQLESSRRTTSSKRHNRFYHYLRTLGAKFSEQQLELICRAMCVTSD